MTTIATTERKRRMSMVVEIERTTQKNATLTVTLSGAPAEIFRVLISGLSMEELQRIREAFDAEMSRDEAQSGDTPKA